MTYPLRRSVTSVVVAVMSAGLGACGGLLLAQDRAPRQGPSSSTASLHVQAVYNRLEPSIVDVAASLRYDGETAEGTGFVINAAHGLVLTNNHVIRDATSVTVTLTSDGRRFPARIVGTDTLADVSLLQLRGATGLVAVPVGNSAAVTTGTPVVAIGNQAGVGGAPTVAPGVISGTGQTIQANDASSGFTEVLRDMLQTSARIAPGDSGGPLADAAGQVIGMDTAQGSGAPATAGYAIPIDDALAAARLIAAGHPRPGVIIGTLGFLGVVVPSSAAADPRTQIHVYSPRTSLPSARPSTPAPCLQTSAAAGVPAAIAPVHSGALVQGVLCGTGAAAAGLAPGDVITRAAGHPVTSPHALTAIMGGRRPGTFVSVTWVRPSGARHTSLVRLDPAPAQ